MSMGKAASGDPEGEEATAEGARSGTYGIGDGSSAAAL